MAFELGRNFQSSLVATAPSPASSGTSLVVTAGEGTLFDTPPFNAVVCPVSAQPTAANSEVVRVTAKSTDTFSTIVRAQEGSSARSIQVGDRIFVPVTAKTFTDIQTALDGKQALDATLTALAGLATGSNKLAYSDGTDSFAQTDFTSTARSLLDDTSVAAMRDTLLAKHYMKPTVADFIENRGVFGTGALTNNTMLLTPIWLAAGTLDQLICEVTTQGASSNTIRMGLYADSGNGRPTGAALVDGGTVSTTASTGNKTVSINTAISSSGWYWFALVSQTGTAAQIRIISTVMMDVHPTSSFGGAFGENNGWQQTSVTGALPTIGSLSSTINVQHMGARYSAVT